MGVKDNFWEGIKNEVLEIENSPKNKQFNETIRVLMEEEKKLNDVGFNVKFIIQWLDAPNTL